MGVALLFHIVTKLTIIVIDLVRPLPPSLKELFQICIVYVLTTSSVDHGVCGVTHKSPKRVKTKRTRGEESEHRRHLVQNKKGLLQG